MPVIINCAQCGGSFSVSPYRAKTARFCSRTCQGEAQTAEAASRAERELASGAKECSRCREVLPLWAFSSDKTRIGGLYPWCAGCAAENQEGRYEADSEAKKSRARERYWRDPEARRSESRVYQTENKASIIAAKRSYYLKNRDRIIRRQSEYVARNRERSAATKRNYEARKLKAEGSHSGADVLKLWHFQRGECARCGTRFGKGPADAGYHVDHVTPLNRGGNNWPRNLQLLCPTCNCSKQDRTPAEFSLYLRRTGTE